MNFLGSHLSGLSGELATISTSASASGITLLVVPDYSSLQLVGPAVAQKGSAQNSMTVMHV